MLAEACMRHRGSSQPHAQPPSMILLPTCFSAAYGATREWAQKMMSDVYQMQSYCLFFQGQGILVELSVSLVISFKDGLYAA